MVLHETLAQTSGGIYVVVSKKVEIQSENTCPFLTNTFSNR